jgi:prepilin-type N-terminal cleavage/methylation domain-containing protein/prepilin-type processing-associated H-X9-DG protein
MRKKGFTLVELLVVIAIIAMLLAILMPALNKVRQIAYRMTCGSNLSGLGKACLTYANDYQDSYPLFGAGQFTWSNTVTTYKWDYDTTTNSYPGDTSRYSSGSATITESLYLLVKYSDVSTGQFVCKATSAKKFDLTLANPVTTNTTHITDLTQCWDFGSITGPSYPWQFCSYSYQMPYKVQATGTSYPLTTSAQAGMAVMADDNPWMSATGTFNPNCTSPATATTGPYLLQMSDFTTPTTSPSISNKNNGRLANSSAHQNDGQNVLYADCHVTFESTPLVGIQQDNIYTTWDKTSANGATTIDYMIGNQPTSCTDAVKSISQDPADSFLAN